MTEMDPIIDLHLPHDRLGPGGDEQTRRAIEMAGLVASPSLSIIDIGCGTGASSLVLAEALGARVAAVDAAEPFVRRVRERAAARGLGDRIDARVGSMEALADENARFDAVWSEGAIYCMGFQAGLAAWRRLLRPGGVLAVSELTWTTAKRPAGVEAHWTRNYPGIATAAEKLALVEAAGYAPLSMFFLPAECWLTNYYEPLRASLPAFLERHGDSAAARAVVAETEAEMALYRDWGEWFGYAFYIARALPG